MEKKHQNTVLWVEINLAQRKGLRFHQARCNAIIFHETLTAHCVPKVVRMENGQVKYEKVSIPSIASKRCRKRTQEDTDEERVTAKSKPLMNLVSRLYLKVRGKPNLKVRMYL